MWPPMRLDGVRTIISPVPMPPSARDHGCPLLAALEDEREMLVRDAGAGVVHGHSRVAHERGRHRDRAGGSVNRRRCRAS